jgi:predicted nucleic acid-binding protein
VSPPQSVFIDTSAWVGIMIAQDPAHARAATQWARLLDSSSKLFTSVPVVIETFTHLQRKYDARVAAAWREQLGRVPRLTTLACSEADLAAAWRWIDRKDLHKLSLVDATSFSLMAKHKIRTAFTFDVHFATAGFGVVG